MPDPGRTFMYGGQQLHVAVTLSRAGHGWSVTPDGRCGGHNVEHARPVGASRCAHRTGADTTASDCLPSAFSVTSAMKVPTRASNAAVASKYGTCPAIGMIVLRPAGISRAVASMLAGLARKSLSPTASSVGQAIPLRSLGSSSVVKDALRLISNCVGELSARNRSRRAR